MGKKSKVLMMDWFGKKTTQTANPFTPVQDGLKLFIRTAALAVMVVALVTKIGNKASMRIKLVPGNAPLWGSSVVLMLLALNQIATIILHFLSTTVYLLYCISTTLFSGSG